MIGPDNYISSIDHCYKDISYPIMQQGGYSPKTNGHNEILIGKGSWIGTHCAIVGDVHIGNNCVIGANTVVLHDVPNYSVVVGNPGKVIKQFDTNDKEWKIINVEDCDC